MPEGECLRGAIMHLFVLSGKQKLLELFLLSLKLEETWKKVNFSRLANHCYDCPDIKCFVRKNRENLKALAVKEKQQKNPKGHQEAFIQERHFYPQSWWCDFANHQDQFDTIKYSRSSRFYHEFVDYLKQQGAPESTLKPLAEVMPKTTVHHETYKDPLRKKLIRQIYSDPEIMRDIAETYYYDFTMFGFKLAMSQEGNISDHSDDSRILNALQLYRKHPKLRHPKTS